MNWTKEEKDALMDHVWASDAETVDEQIEHAHYQMYQSGETEFKERSLNALKNMFYKTSKERKSMNHEQ